MDITGLFKKKIHNKKNRIIENVKLLSSKGEINKLLDYIKYKQIFFSDLKKYYDLYLLIKKIENLEFVPRELLQEKNTDILIISLSVWGEKYLHLFEKVFIPSFLPNSVIQDITSNKKILLNIYVPSNDIKKIKDITTKIYGVQINIIDIGKLITSNKSFLDSSFRYCIYGSLHNADLLVAKKINADYMPISPDNVHSHGSLKAYLECIKQGYKVVLVSGIRVQSEEFLKEILKLFNNETKELVVSSSDLVALAANNIHHEFRRYFLFKNNNRIPEIMSLRIYPEKNYFKMNSYHLHPILISKEHLKKIKKVDYLTVDSGLIKHLNIDQEFFDKEIKVIQNSDIACMADLSTLYKDISLDKFIEKNYTMEHELEQAKYFSAPIYRWNFSKDIIYNSEKELRYRTFDNIKNELVSVELN